MEAPKGPTFSLDIASPGASTLRHTVKAKLSEFMGSYTDDVLSEYVVVLVGHGKHKAQATKDLEAFLGDQSKAFVSWLWEHLTSNIHLYTSVPKPTKVSPKDGFGDNEQIVKGLSGEPVKEKDVDSQAAGKSQALVSSVTHEEENLAGDMKDANTGLDAKKRKTSDASGYISGRGKIEYDSVNHKSDRPATREVHRSRDSVRSSKRPRSPDAWMEKERNRTDERHHHKRHASPPRVNASRRLLESAVREAVAPAGAHLKRSESSLKRLRSVVSAETDDADANGQQLKVMARTDHAKQGKRAIPAMVVAMKAAAAAAEDVNKVRGRHMGSVWDRLGKNSDGVDQKEEHAVEPIRDVDSGREEVESKCIDTKHHAIEGEEISKRSRVGSVSERFSKNFADDNTGVLSDNPMDRYAGGHSTIMGRNMYIAGLKGSKRQADERDDEQFEGSDAYNDGRWVRSKDRLEKSHEESVTVQYRLAQNMDDSAKENHIQKGSSTSPGLTNSSQKIVNISVNVNTWKPASYETLKDVADIEHPTTTLMPKQSLDLPDKTEDAEPLKTSSTKDIEHESNNDQNVTDVKKQMRQVQLEVTKLKVRQGEVTKEMQKATTDPVHGVSPTALSQDGIDIRTVFVTNIHFAATKESVMAHFSKCGEVVRTVMLTDAATGQPKGSAYVEFSSKEAADKALTLNESSFFSRVLKVVRKSTAIHEPAPIPVRPPIIRRSIPLSLRVPVRAMHMRGSPYLLRRFGSMPRPYANAPNLQWKRDGPTSAGVYGSRPGYGSVRLARSFSYVRTASNTTSPTPGSVQGQKDFAELEQKDGSKAETNDDSAQEPKESTEQDQKSG